MRVSSLKLPWEADLLIYSLYVILWSAQTFHHFTYLLWCDSLFFFLNTSLPNTSSPINPSYCSLLFGKPQGNCSCNWLFRQWWLYKSPLLLNEWCCGELTQTKHRASGIQLWIPQTAALVLARIQTHNKIEETLGSFHDPLAFSLSFSSNVYSEERLKHVSQALTCHVIQHHSPPRPTHLRIQ